MLAFLLVSVAFGGSQCVATQSWLECDEAGMNCSGELVRAVGEAPREVDAEQAALDACARFIPHADALRAEACEADCGSARRSAVRVFGTQAQVVAIRKRLGRLDRCSEGIGLGTLSRALVTFEGGTVIDVAITADSLTALTLCTATALSGARNKRAADGEVVVVVQHGVLGVREYSR
jgi:hypothetical protein